MTRNCTKRELVIFGRKKSRKLAKKGRLSHRFSPSPPTNFIGTASICNRKLHHAFKPSKTPLRSFTQCSQVEHLLRPRGQRLLAPQSLPGPPSGATPKLRRRLLQNRLLRCSASTELMPVPWYVLSGSISKMEMAIGTPGPASRCN